MAKSKISTEEKIKEFFDLIGIIDPFEVVEDEDSITVTLNSEDPGMIIGHHGDTLDSVQLVLSLVIAKNTGEFKRVSLEVGDYKKNRADYLRNLAEQTKQRVLTEGQEIYLPSLKPWERREVHMYLSDDEEVVSESVGEGKDRTLVVKPK
jgi:spoIIIJ-associated protein